jgi:hypothetical protein
MTDKHDPAEFGSLPSASPQEELWHALAELISRCSDVADVIERDPHYDAVGFLRASAKRYSAILDSVSSSRGPTPDPPTIDPAIMALAEKVLRRDRTMTFPGEAYRLAAAFKEAVSAFRGSVTRPPEPQGWRDIESAPRNYESVLLCAAHTRTVREGYWSTESKAWQTLICEGPNDLLWTHWMPLPGPPKDGSQ